MEFGGAGFFEEAQELSSIVQRAVASEGRDAAQLYDRFKGIVST